MPNFPFDSDKEEQQFNRSIRKEARIHNRFVNRYDIYSCAVSTIALIVAIIALLKP